MCSSSTVLTVLGPALMSEGLTPHRGWGRVPVPAPSSASAPERSLCHCLWSSLGKRDYLQQVLPEILHLGSPNRGCRCRDRQQITPVQPCPRELSAPKGMAVSPGLEALLLGGQRSGRWGPLHNDPGRAAQFSRLHGTTSHLEAALCAAPSPDTQMHRTHSRRGVSRKK